MKKACSFVMIFMALSCFSGAQSVGINNIVATTFSNGALFWNGGNVFFEVPKGSGLTTMFASHLWMGGYDNQGRLHVAAQTYAQAGEGGPAFTFGPVVDSGSYSPTQLNQAFNRAPVLLRSDISNHQAQFNDAGYIVPQLIANWTGSGDTSRGVSPVLLPFHDSNGDGQYTPQSGDFPVMWGDQAQSVLFSDNRVLKEAGNRRMNINVVLQTYAFDAPSDSALNNTLFVRYMLHNVSGINYDSVFLAHFADPDIGAYTDDYIGSDSVRQCFYAYNSSNFDDPANGGYGANPPAQGIVFLSHPLDRFIYYNNDTSALGNPVNFIEKYQYMRGLNRAGQPMTQRYMFNGDPVAGTGSNEVSLNSTPGDRRGLGVIPPFALPAGGRACIDIAYVYGRGSSNLNSITVMRERVDAVRTWYGSQNFSCEGLYTSVAPKPIALSGKTYPNPFTSDLMVSLEAPLLNDGWMELRDLAGRVVCRKAVMAGESSWQLFPEVQAGMYLLSLQSQDKHYYSRVVKR